MNIRERLAAAAEAKATAIQEARDQVNALVHFVPNYGYVVAEYDKRNLVYTAPMIPRYQKQTGCGSLIAGSCLVIAKDRNIQTYKTKSAAQKAARRIYSL